MPDTARTVFQFSPLTRLGGAFAAGLLWVLTLGLFLAGLVFLVSGKWIGAAFLAGLALLGLPLCLLVQADTMAKWRWSVSPGPDSVHLVLPAGRSWLHRPPSFEGEIAYADIDAVVQRPERYSQFGTQSRVEPCWIVRKDGSRLLLGEDRQASRSREIMTETIIEAAAAIAGAAGLPVTRMAAADGQPGLLGVWGARPPAWPRDESGSRQE